MWRSERDSFIHLVPHVLNVRAISHLLSANHIALHCCWSVDERDSCSSQWIDRGTSPLALGEHRRSCFLSTTRQRVCVSFEIARCLETQKRRKEVSSVLFLVLHCWHETISSICLCFSIDCDIRCASPLSLSVTNMFPYFLILKIRIDTDELLFMRSSQSDSSMASPRKKHLKLFQSRNKWDSVEFLELKITPIVSRQGNRRLPTHCFLSLSLFRDAHKTPFVPSILEMRLAPSFQQLSKWRWLLVNRSTPIERCWRWGRNENGREKNVDFDSLSRFLRRTLVEMFLRSYAWILLMFFFCVSPWRRNSTTFGHHWSCFTISDDRSLHFILKTLRFSPLIFPPDVRNGTSTFLEPWSPALESSFSSAHWNNSPDDHSRFEQRFSWQWRWENDEDSDRIRFLSLSAIIQLSMDSIHVVRSFDPRIAVRSTRCSSTIHWPTSSSSILKRTSAIKKRKRFSLLCSRLSMIRTMKIEPMNWRNRIILKFHSNPVLPPPRPSVFVLRPFTSLHSTNLTTSELVRERPSFFVISDRSAWRKCIPWRSSMTTTSH